MFGSAVCMLSKSYDNTFGMWERKMFLKMFVPENVFKNGCSSRTEDPRQLRVMDPYREPVVILEIRNGNLRWL